jgi:hypothetical protein
MPLSYPLHPSSQLGYLHAYVGQEFADRLSVRSHSAFLDILSEFAGEDMAEFFETYSLVGEEILFLVNCYHEERLGRAGAPGAIAGLGGKRFDELLKRYHDYDTSPDNDSQQAHPAISKRKIVALHDAMVSYLEHKLIPALADDGLNVVGLTATFCQVFGSIFAARYLARHTTKRVLFVFGGSSFGLPEGTRTLARWGLDGLLVAGSGERPLTHILQACLALGPPDDRDPADAIDRLNLVNVTRVGAPHKSIDLRMPKAFLATLPDPDFDEFFASFRARCEDVETYQYARANFISIPLEGSRGCFARCDFCHNPEITSEFRSLEGRQVAERAITLCEKYGVHNVTFVDSVCNTWAGTYADHLLARGVRIPAFMEMRVHATEAYWTKLALAGLESVQFGVEALSEGLLHSMRKGTKVVQNLSATKYTAELGLRVPSNLIIHHPKSTVADVEETRRVLGLAEHFPAFSLSLFVVSYASPIYHELADDRKARLSRGFDWVPPDLIEHSWPRHLSYTYPSAWIDPEVVAAWNGFQAWHDAHAASVAARQPVFTVEARGDERHFVDSRFGRHRRYAIAGELARAHDVCHQVSTAARVADQLGLPADRVAGLLAELVERALVIDVGGHHLSLALRPRDVLIANLANKRTSDHGPAARRALPLASSTIIRAVRR